LHAAIGEDRLEDPAEHHPGVEVDGTAARPANCPVGAGAGAVLEADEALVGEGAPEPLGSERGTGGVSVGMGPTMDLPGPRPDLWGDGLQEAGRGAGLL